MLEMRGININGELHTGTDLDLLFLGYDDEMPEPKTLTEDIIGANGITDYTNHAGLLTKFSNRYPVFHFFATGSKKEIASAFERLSVYHGQTVSVFADDDPGFYFRGRATIAKVSTGARYAYFDLSLDAFPYKLSRSLTVLNFDFDQKTVFQLINNVMPVKITAQITDVSDPSPSDSAIYAARFTCGGKSSIVKKGMTSQLDYIISGGSQSFEVVGGRTVSTNFFPYNDYGIKFCLSFREGKF
ncbi:MAG: hypothetical protein UFA98_01130 [Ruminococcus sp.]|nr:hypothetical protein [Ruminococcus sp.]